LRLPLRPWRETYLPRKGAKEDAKAQRIAAFVPLCGIDYNAKSFSLLPHLTRGNLQNWRMNSLT
jgi:hypothetical protein